MVKEKILARLPQGIQATQKHKFHTKSAYVQQEIPLLKKFSVITALHLFMSFHKEEDSVISLLDSIQTC